MQPGKFLTIFRTLNSKEKKSFRAFLGSPYPINEPLLISLFDLVKEADSDTPVVRELLWASLYQDQEKEYRDDHMRKLLSDLAKRLELFLSLEGYLQNVNLSGPVLLHALNARGLDKYFLQNLRKLKEKYAWNEPYQSPATLLASIRSDWEEYEYKLRGGRQVGSLTGILNKLDFYYVLEGLKFLTEHWSILSVIQGEEPMNPKERVLLMAREAPFCDHPVVSIYLGILDLFLSENEGDSTLAAFTHAQWVLDEHTNLLNRDEAGFLYSFVINHGVRMVNQSSGNTQRKYLRVVADLHESIIRKKILHVHGHLPEFLFKNYMTNMLKSGDFERAQDALEKMPNEIHPDHRNQAVLFNSAALHFYMKDYSNTLKFLHESSLEDEFYDLDARSMMMITLFEQGEYEALRARLDANQRFLRRNPRLTETRKQRHLNRVKLLRRLIKLVDRPELNRNKLAVLRKKVIDEPELIDRDYLLEKIALFLEQT